MSQPAKTGYCCSLRLFCICTKILCTCLVITPCRYTRMSCRDRQRSATVCAAGELMHISQSVRCARVHTKGQVRLLKQLIALLPHPHLQFVTARLQQSYLAANILPSAMFTACQFYSTHADSTVCSSKQAFRALVQLHDTK